MDTNLTPKWCAGPKVHLDTVKSNSIVPSQEEIVSMDTPKSNAMPPAGLVVLRLNSITILWRLVDSVVLTGFQEIKMNTEAVLRWTVPFLWMISSEEVLKSSAILQLTKKTVDTVVSSVPLLWIMLAAKPMSLVNQLKLPRTRPTVMSIVYPLLDRTMATVMLIVLDSNWTLWLLPMEEKSSLEERSSEDPLVRILKFPTMKLEAALNVVPTTVLRLPL